MEAAAGRIAAALAAGAAVHGRRGYTVARAEHDIAAIWQMRKKTVGLLGNTPSDKRPVAFVEDTAVPPEHLAEYVAEFRAALDARGLEYGMFGHVDARVLHVRPALDLKDPAQEPLVRAVTEDVVALTQKCGGLLWGEHGACFSWDPDEPMCPSFKVTRDRRHSPKGRASLVREWLRQLAAQGFDPAQAAPALRQAPWGAACRRGCGPRWTAAATSTTR